MYPLEFRKNVCHIPKGFPPPFPKWTRREPRASPYLAMSHTYERWLVGGKAHQHFDRLYKVVCPFGGPFWFGVATTSISGYINLVGRYWMEGMFNVFLVNAYLGQFSFRFFFVWFNSVSFMWTCSPSSYMFLWRWEAGSSLAKEGFLPPILQVRRLVRPIHRYTFSSNDRNLMPSPRLQLKTNRHWIPSSTPRTPPGDESRSEALPGLGFSRRISPCPRHRPEGPGRALKTSITTPPPTCKPLHPGVGFCGRLRPTSTGNLGLQTPSSRGRIPPSRPLSTRVEFSFSV